MKATARPVFPAALSSVRTRPALWVWLLVGGLAVGSADLLFAMAWWAPSGTPPIRILQSIAAWFVGRETAFAGGAAAALGGAVFYYALMTAIVAGYRVAARDRIALRTQPLRHGALYGAICFVLLHVVIVPLFSAAPPKRFLFDWNLACLLAHMLLIGIPAALMARRWYDGAR
jgi:hypothetical protein